jgi:TPR repeat protein
MNIDPPELLEAVELLFSGDRSASVIEVLKRFAEAGNPKAQCNLATCYHLGVGVKVDIHEAIRLYEIVAAQNIHEGYLSAIACNNVAGIFVLGAHDISPNPQKAEEYRALCRSLGFPMAL